MAGKYVGAVDQGTTGTRFMVFDSDGSVVASQYQEHRQIYPRPGYVEHDANEIWSNTKLVMHGALEQSGIKVEDLAAIGITNQRETTLVWDRESGEPLTNAIVWQDTRTRERCEELKQRGQAGRIQRKTGLVVATYFSAPKLEWILDSVKGARRAAERGRLLFGTVDSWLIWWLTGGPNGGVHLTDCTNASRTMLMDLRSLQWDRGLLKLFDIPPEMLPAIRPSSDRRRYGHALGAVPVTADLGDQHAALFGQTCFRTGEGKNTYGTGSFLLVNTGSTPVRSRHGLLTTVAYGLQPGRCNYALEGSIAVTGAAVQWLRDNLEMIGSAEESEAVAGSVPDSGGIYFVPAFSGLFAPHWDMDARGTIVGLTRYVTRAHLVRATLEAICYQTAEVVAVMEKESGSRLRSLKVDGGAVSNDLLMQLQADILGVPVVRAAVTETTALGAAYAAGLAVGFWSSLSSLRKNAKVGQTFRPASTPAARASGMRGWKRAVERSRGWLEPGRP
jgi:glycerol kinase